MKSLQLDVPFYDTYLFHEGKHFRSYEFLGSKPIEYDNTYGVQFRVWAPNAVNVRIVGNFNRWDGTDYEMYKEESGFWAIFISGISEGDIYKYEIFTKNNEVILKSDPYAFYSEMRPNTASVIVNMNNYIWHDKDWIEQRSKKNIFENPVNIYEVHLGSWKRDENNNFYSYREIADELVEYVKDMGYTHIEILPVTEHPLDGSWGYQTTGYYSITSRFGKPNDFKYFVDKFHENGIGIILDWVPGHFCKDAHGLYKFDGTPLYEYDNSKLSENYDWGTANFDLSKLEVHSFLISNAVFWFKEYHIDGIRADAVANMLYLTYGKKENSPIRNKYGGNENLEAVDFIKKLNKVIFEYFTNLFMMAEESTAWPMVTGPTDLGGLGFNYKWNMGWMNDMLKYMETDIINRKSYQKLITFPLMYAFSENFILPLSHDEVVHGKKSLLNKMPGSYEQKFKGIRLFYGYMMSHPGKKLLFMGGEFGQFIEWRYDCQLDWEILDYPSHDSLKRYVRDLNHFYLKEKALWQQDHTSEGFCWIDHQNYSQSIVSFIRKSKDNDDFIIIVCNFTSILYQDFKVGVPRFTNYIEVLNSDRDIYGGNNYLNTDDIHPIREKWNNQPYHINIKIPPLSTIFIKPIFLK
ncbi:1,4-alpha-glucan branching protein GlgB [Clostridium aestuarii]|uniref:1,4-alpha-glucan branching enzyme GlgB n=1 Tax=Clostridium aestuarii TaxID=338193 RepID=A0ABT4CY16_9CLOT|nr:1,4-alpha-glucan branching protein GlgB [Clostridium aestuarii]MCY6483866.1 1,4-alpha-glucan branching protein GlgB [Clostridium aestuarii]